MSLNARDCESTVGCINPHSQPAPEVDDDDLRVLEVKKNNCGPISENILLRWRNGVYVPEPLTGSFEKMAADAKVDNLFLELLRRFTRQERNVSPSRSPTYAPTQFANAPEAKAAKVKAKAFAEAMERLLAANKIKIIREGSPARYRDRIAEVKT